MKLRWILCSLIQGHFCDLTGNCFYCGKPEPKSMSRRIEKIERELARLRHDIDRLFRILERRRFPFTLTIKELCMIPLDPGNSPVFTATPQPDGTSFGSQVPVWTISDSTFTLAPDPTGVNCTVNIPATATVGASVTITATVTSADGKETATGSATFTIGAPPAKFPTSLGVAQTA
jgi:hypothetical protein